MAATRATQSWLTDALWSSGRNRCHRRRRRWEKLKQKQAGKAHKICTLDGDWYRHPMTNRYWSNYTTCVDTVDLAVSRRWRASLQLSRAQARQKH